MVNCWFGSVVWDWNWNFYMKYWLVNRDPNTMDCYNFPSIQQFSPDFLIMGGGKVMTVMTIGPDAAFTS